MTTHGNAGPCARFEYEIADLVDEQLPPDREAVLRNHLAICAPCRGWLEEYSNVDAALASEISPVSVPGDFEARLKARIAQAGPSSASAPTLLGLDDEYRRVLASLREQMRRRILASVPSAAAMAGAAWLAADQVLSRSAAFDQAVSQAGPITAYGALSIAISLGALGWAAWRGLLPAPRR
jgi:anti-sigma factor RsiW